MMLDFKGIVFSVSFLKVSFFCFLIASCSRLDSHTQVLGEKENSQKEREEKEYRQAIEESLLTNKQSLRIALLKLDIDNVSSKKILIFGDELIPFGALENFTPERALEVHQDMFPEYYRLLSIVEKRSLPLVFICKTKWKCDIIKMGLSPIHRGSSQFLSDGPALKKLDQKSIYFSLGGRDYRNQTRNAVWRYPLFDLRFSQKLQQLSIQSWLDLKSLPQ